jgi:hypothetical protein
MKYYWLVYSYNNAGGSKTNVEEAVSIHPFKYMNDKKNGTRGAIDNVTLLNWKEIRKKEFDMFGH